MALPFESTIATASHPPTARRPTRATPATYRRRRAVAGAAALVVVAVVLLSLLGARASADTEVGVEVRPPAVYVVRPGDSLWSIAAELAPQRDPRPVVAALQRAAGKGDIQPGQRILVPPGLQR